MAVSRSIYVSIADPQPPLKATLILLCLGAQGHLIYADELFHLLVTMKSLLYFCLLLGHILFATALSLPAVDSAGAGTRPGQARGQDLKDLV